MSKKSQTATEYMIILAVVLIISLIVVSSLGGIPSIGIGVGNRVTEAELRSGKIGITSYAITEDKTIATIQNNERETVTINSFNLKGINCEIGTITLAPGQSRTIECDNFNSSLGTSFGNDVPVQVSYTTSAGAVFNQEYGDYGGVSSGGASPSDDSWCTDNGGIVLPFNESLCWQQEVQSNPRTHGQAQSYCAGLDLGGGLEWHLPEDYELLGDGDTHQEGSLLWWMNDERGYTQGTSAGGRNYGTWLNNTWGFTGFENQVYWSNTYSDPPDNNNAWGVNLDAGSVVSVDFANYGRVVCVSWY